MIASDIRVAVWRALRLIEAHPSVVEVAADVVEGTSNVLAVISIKTELANEWRAVGASPSGVRTIEPVSFFFPDSYPLSAPKIRLRRDFIRGHPHLQPGKPEDAPEPCLVAGSPRELLRLRSILGLVDQLVEWLERAAFLRLIDPKQGWEPVRRDHIDDILVADAEWLTGLATKNGGCAAFNIRYFASLAADASLDYGITLQKSNPIAIGPTLTSEFTFRNVDTSRIGSGVALVAWPGKTPGGSPFIADKYLPETVTTVDGLLARAAEVGCREHLEPKLVLLQTRLRESKMKEAVPLAVILLARRPFPVINTRSSLEIIPYVVEIGGRDDLSSTSRKVVRAAMHREDISVPLLRRASGEADDAKAPPWTLFGCGSVGSKIAIHMARAGRGPSAIVDSANIQPHNFARHGTFPYGSSVDRILFVPKTMVLGEALAGLKQSPTTCEADVVAHVQAKKTLASLFTPDSFAIVNTTGSASVREVLSSHELTGPRPRIVEACLLGLGRVAILTVEGAQANPSSTDLICECYREIHTHSEISETVFGTAAAEVAIGQGCSAVTMPLPDSRLSMFAASMADRIAKLQREGLPADDGHLLIGHLADDGLSQQWIAAVVKPRIVVGSGATGEVRISPAVDETIRTEIARKPNSETGGIIYGRYCDVTNNFHVVGTSPAPPDSRFSKNEFVLGVSGLKPMLRDLIEGSGGALYPLGTWHNHLVPSGASAKDMRTAILLSGLQYFPLLMLIHTPKGYVRLTVETVKGRLDG